MMLKCDCQGMGGGGEQAPLTLAPFTSEKVSREPELREAQPLLSYTEMFPFCTLRFACIFVNKDYTYTHILYVYKTFEIKTIF